MTGHYWRTEGKSADEEHKERHTSFRRSLGRNVSIAHCRDLCNIIYDVSVLSENYQI